MADKIKLLPDIVANQIAAGEVVQEPASVVKEMMENALDAGAKRIDVEFTNGGLSCITIVDNGCGMSPIDARMAFDRHATSKIATIDDIYTLRTLGFRGEALASIAAVSEITLRTRQKDDDIGTETIIKFGDYESQKPVMTPAGSCFKVLNLLSNVPARRKFLPEQGYRLSTAIRAEFNRIALCNPDVELHLIEKLQKCEEGKRNEAKLINISLRPSSLAGRIVDVIGNSIKNNLLEVGADTSIVKIKGYIGRPEVAKKRNSEQYLFVNGRFFKSPYISKAIFKAYEKLIPSDYFPSYFIYIEVDPEMVDVNVSPQKTEVKFTYSEHIWQILNAAVRETLAKTGGVPLMDFDSESNVEIPISQRGAVYDEPKSAYNEMYNPFLIEDENDESNDNDDTGKISDYAREGYLNTRAGSAGGSRQRRMPVNTIKPNGEFGAEFSTANDVWEVTGSSSEEEFDDFESGMGFVGTQSAGNGELPIEERAAFRSVTYIGNGYAAALYGNSFVLVDLRRAAERVLYEQYLLLMGNNSSTSQQLLFPEKIVLSNDEYALLEENTARFAALGFDLKPEGGGTVTILGVPAETDDEDMERLLLELLHTFSLPLDSERLRNENIAAAMARSNAGKTVRNMSDSGAAQLLERLSITENTAFSPAGKRIMTVMTADDIKHKLG